MPATSLSRVPHLDQWFGLWAMEEARFWSGFEFVRHLDLHLHLENGAVEAAQQQPATAANGKLFEQRGGIALIGLHGRMMKHASSLSDGTSTVLVRRQIRAAAADAGVQAILLHIDSPGGTAAGTADLAADIGAAGQQKPVWSYVEDLCASAAYWAGSQAHRVSANPTALVGSIGTYGVVYDMSGAAAMEGVKALVVRAGKFKGMGTPGTEVTQEQLAEMQRTVDGLNEHFIAGVAAGRKLDPAAVRELADGRVHIAKEARRLALIDAVESFDQTFQRLEKESRSGRKPMTMAEHVIPETSAADAPTAGVDIAHRGTLAHSPVPSTVPAVLVATYDEIKSGCLGADPQFICSQLEAKATLPQAQATWMAEQNRRIQAASERAEQAALRQPGVDPLPAGSKPPSRQVESDALSAFDEAVVGEMDRSRVPRHVAQRKVCVAHPELREAMVAAHNSQFGRTRQ